MYSLTKVILPEVYFSPEVRDEAEEEITMKIFGLRVDILSGIAVISLLAVPMYAVEVQYTTVGIFNCHGLAGCTVTNLGGGDSKVVVTNNGGTNVAQLIYTHGSDDFTPDDGQSLITNFNAGVVNTNAKGAGQSFNGITLDVQVSQSIPGPTATGDFLATITGGASVGNHGAGHVNTTAVASFLPTEITLNNVVYSIDSPERLAPGAAGTTFQGSLDASALPEPAFFALTGIGFFGMFGIAWSRYKQRA